MMMVLYLASVMKAAKSVQVYMEKFHVMLLHLKKIEINNSQIKIYNYIIT